MDARLPLQGVWFAGLAVGLAACGPSSEEWQAKLAEATDLQQQVQQRDWQLRADEQRIQGLTTERDRLTRQLADLQAQFDAQGATVRQLQSTIAQERQQAAVQAAYPTALLGEDGATPEGGPRTVAHPPIDLRHVGMEWHWRSSHGGEATVSFSAGVRQDLSGYCSLCTIWVRAACSNDAVTLTDVRAIGEAENIMDMGPGDTAEMSSAMFRHAPLDAHPTQCDISVSLSETSDERGGVLLGQYCWTDDGEVRERACRP